MHALDQRLRQGDMDNIHAEDGNRNNHANKILTNPNKLLNKFTLSFQCAMYSAASLHSLIHLSQEQTTLYYLQKRHADIINHCTGYKQ